MEVVDSTAADDDDVAPRDAFGATRCAGVAGVAAQAAVPTDTSATTAITLDLS
jgi:hypothetical protein